MPPLVHDMSLETNGASCFRKIVSTIRPVRMLGHLVEDCDSQRYHSWLAVEEWGQRGDLSSRPCWLLQGCPLELAALSP
jgi:hypothetical protein